MIRGRWLVDRASLNVEENSNSSFITNRARTVSPPGQFLDQRFVEPAGLARLGRRDESLAGQGGPLGRVAVGLAGQKQLGVCLVPVVAGECEQGLGEGALAVGPAAPKDGEDGLAGVAGQAVAAGARADSMSSRSPAKTVARNLSHVGASESGSNSTGASW